MKGYQFSCLRSLSFYFYLSIYFGSTALLIIDGEASYHSYNDFCGIPEVYLYLFSQIPSPDEIASKGHS